ncbi:hypothetical protein PFISCL1PPCAC_26106, partial [Pristionchus fissidentatus]
AEMWQFFHTKVDDIVLFEGWKVDQPSVMLLACAITFVAGIGFEFVKFARRKIVRALKQRQDPNYSPSPIAALFTAPHLVGTAFFALQLSVGYVLMLIVMTFSVWLCLAVIAGATIGFVIFDGRD